jgi:predicted CopG family antitoxin
MAKTIQLPDDVYERIRRVKKNLSFSEIIGIFLDEYNRKKKVSKVEFLKFLENFEELHKDRKKERISERIDEILWQ